MGSGLDDAIAPLVDSLLGQMAAKDELWGLCHCRTGFSRKLEFSSWSFLCFKAKYVLGWVLCLFA